MADAKISRAFWKSTHTGLIILRNDWGSASGKPPLKFDGGGFKFKTLQALTAAQCGRYSRYYRRKGSWVFTIRAKRYPQLAEHPVPVYLAGSFNGWGDAMGNPRWELKRLAHEEGFVYELSVPLMDIPDDGVSQFKFVTENGDWLDVPDSAPNVVMGKDGVANFEFNPAQSGGHMYSFSLPKAFEACGRERIVWKDRSYQEVHELPHTQLLLKMASDLPMGAWVEGDATCFRLFAPRATGVKVCYGRAADGSDVRCEALEAESGPTWAVTIDQDLDGWFYSFRVEGRSVDGTSHFEGSFPVLDPYAKACVGHRGPGIVVAPERLEKVRKAYQPPAWHDLVIMECHVRDLAAHAPIQLEASERMGYAGVRKWLKSEHSYLKEMGINAVELQPIQEFDNRKREDYHWGYMTANYFAPESSYAQDPEAGSQIEEFKGLVEDFHAEGIAVIVDVVYNHVGEPNHLLFVDKYYYFHVDDANDLVNWSGCGNDLRCNTPMGRRLIVESLKHLVEVYDVDGFRFDLAELIGIEVLREIELELKAIKPSIILIAEPWSFRGHIQDELRETGFASWNDGFREGIAKYVKGAGNQDMIRYFLSGSPGTSRFAAQTINYTESHDDHCWLDVITERKGHNGADPTLLDRRRTHLMASILFASLGVPMVAAGQDFMRSKRGVENTYQRGDLNALDYNQRFVNSGTHSYFRAWIRFRLSSLGAALRYDGGLQAGYIESYFADGLSAVVQFYNADRSRQVPQVVFGVNPHLEYANIACPELAAMHLVQLADWERFEVNGLPNARIPVKDGVVSLPPLSCGLWVIVG